MHTRKLIALVVGALIVGTGSAFALHGRAVVNVALDVQNSASPASSTHFSAWFSGSNQNPPVTVGGTGTGSFILDGSGLHYWITITDLTGDITGAHFHNAASGSNGGVVFSIGDTFSGNTASGVWKISAGMIDELLKGNIYVNIHTADNPSGEVRGQVDISSGIGFTSSIGGAAEVPSVDGSGSGSAALILDGDGLHYWITVDDLTGPITGAHFHNAAAGASGGVVFSLTDSFTGNTASGVWDIDTDMLGELLAGGLYINVHTDANPPGEIRGQVWLASGARMISSLSGSNEVPAITVDGSGTALFVWDQAGLHYWITATDLTGPITGAHFHNAPADESGGVVFGITDSFTGNSAAGVWDIGPEMIAELLDGNIYVNIHTGANASGELRGQLGTSTGVGFVAAIGGGNEVPDSEADGTGTGAFLWDGTGFQYWITVDDLTGPITGAHFHNAPAGENGGVVFAITDSFSGTTATGTWTPSETDLGEIWSGRIYVNIHTAANPGGEVRGQVNMPAPGASGLLVEFSRSIAGAPRDYAWSGMSDGNGMATIEIVAPSDFRFLRLGVNGYYTARVKDPAAGRVIGRWNSIPIRGGKENNLSLPVGSRASNVPGASLTKPATIARTKSIGAVVDFPSAELLSAERDGDQYRLPVRFTRAIDVTEGDVLLQFDPNRVTLDRASVNGRNIDPSELLPGRVHLTLEGLLDREVIALDLVLRSSEGMATIDLSAVLFDQEMMPVLLIDGRTTLGAPRNFALYQNYPNPFNPATQISYDVPEAGNVSLSVYNALGQEVARLVDGSQNAGTHVVRWDAVDAASGIYYYQLRADGFSDTRRMLLVK